jgi:hypothetical protein
VLVLLYGAIFINVNQCGSGIVNSLISLIDEIIFRWAPVATLVLNSIKGKEKPGSSSRLEQLVNEIDDDATAEAAFVFYWVDSFFAKAMS